MTASILSIGTALPASRLTQERARDLFAAQPSLDRRAQRLVHAAFDAAAIETRHTVLTALTGTETTTEDDRMPVLTEAGELLRPTTGARNDAYVRFAPALFAEAARRAMATARVEPSAITHVVTVSCTGMFAPGPDFRLVKDLGLAPTVERYHLGFIGCAAALPALRAAERICTAQPGSVVLVVCAELCTLHFRTSSDPQQIVASSVFADGAAAAIVANRCENDLPRLELGRFRTALTTEGEADMVWIVGDEGFEMTLSAEVPRIIGREIRGAIDAAFGDERIDEWVVHPGGRSVLDRVEAGLSLDPSALDRSREVLRTHGNMSSATILFILAAVLADDTLADGTSVAALAFGPGLTVETALLTRRGAHR